jgi:hypothetical protein
MKRLIMVTIVGFLLLITRIYSADYLLIPESSNQTVGIYCPQEGTYLGDFITDFASFGTPFHARQGPDNTIYVSDQTAPGIFVFDQNGDFLMTYADSSDGVSNIRGIDFWGSNLFISSGDKYIAEFDGPHSRLPNFIDDGSNPFDIFFLPDGRSLLADIENNRVSLYDEDGLFIESLFPISFPEQINQMVSSTDYLNASFTSNIITRFTLDEVVSTIPFQSGRGVYELGNGNLIATNSSGVYELDPSTGDIVNTLRSGIGARYIDLVDIPFTPPPTPTPTATNTPTPVPTNTPSPFPTNTPTPDCLKTGDVDGNGLLSAADAQLAFLIVLGQHTPTYEEECAADCNGDGIVSSADAQDIFLAVIEGGSCADPL